MYKHALEIYESKQWYKVQDHINFMMSRLNYSLKNVGDAFKHVNSIVSKRMPSTGRGHTVAQAPPTHHHHHKSHHAQSNQHNLVEFANEFTVLRDFILYSNTLNQAEDHSSPPSLTLLSVPLVDFSSIEVNLNPSDEAGLRHGHVLVNMENSAELIQNPVGSTSEKSAKRWLFFYLSN